MKTLNIQRPWGEFDQFTENEETTVKLHNVKPGSAWSLQYHNNRSEFWRVVSGHPTIAIGTKRIEANPGDEFMVEKKELHRLETGEEGAVILEICFGAFDEEDIIRVKDKYGRAQ